MMTSWIFFTFPYNNYLARVAPGYYPKMHNAMDEVYLRPQFAEWSLDSDSTIEMPNLGGAPCKYLLSSSFSTPWVIWLANNTSSRGFGRGRILRWKKADVKDDVNRIVKPVGTFCQTRLPY
jgi:hypothetical protein